MNPGTCFSLILLPTLRCNAACDYCFEKKGGGDLTIDGLKIIISAVFDYMNQNNAKALDSGIHMGVIALPNKEILRIGAESLYSYFVDNLNITDFQINTPFPGGPYNSSKTDYPLDNDLLTDFFTDLCRIWIERGYDKNIRIGPLGELTEYFRTGDAMLPCIWQANCANDFICIDPYGNVAQCDCWVASYPDFCFGNIFKEKSVGDILQKNSVHRRFLERPGKLIQNEECLMCDYLAICHGGCPVRAYTTYGRLNAKDPYCKAYKALFDLARHMAACLARKKEPQKDKPCQRRDIQ